jgi:hypothetical protein
MTGKAPKRPKDVNQLAKRIVDIATDDSKLVVSWLVGGRDADYATAFLADLEARLSNRIQLTSDGHRRYADAVYGAFGTGIDYAQLIKIYGGVPEGGHRDPEARGASETAEYLKVSPF